MNLPSNLPKYSPESSSLIKFEDLFYSNEYHGKVVTFYASIFSTNNEEILHAFGNYFILSCSDIHKNFNDYLECKERTPRHQPLSFMIARGNKKNCFEAEIENDELVIFVYTNDSKRITAKNKKFRISGLVNYIGKYDPNNLTISTKKLNIEDCFFHLYLVDISE